MPYKDKEQARLCQSRCAARPENKEKKKQYTIRMAAERSLYNKEYYKQHKEERLAYLKNRLPVIRVHRRARRKSDPDYRLRANLHARTYGIFAQLKQQKPASTFKLLGEHYGFIKAYIEQQFVDGMTWSNYGEWHVDHIIPLASAKNLDELTALCHYSNLQPLWAHDNLTKAASLTWTPSDN